MLNRRQFLSAAAGGAAMFARGPRAFAATYDLIIRGGRFIGPSIRPDAIRDMAISGGRIVALEANIAGNTAPSAETTAQSIFLANQTVAGNSSLIRSFTECNKVATYRHATLNLDMKDRLKRFRFPCRCQSEA